MEKMKRVTDSRIEWFKCVQYEDINRNNKLFGGRLMCWMDEVAGIAAMRHAGMQVTTAAVDNLQFKKSAVLGDILVIEAKITHVGNSSMEVRVGVFREEPSDGLRYVINRAYFTEVCIDEQGRPVKVPYGLLLESEVDRAEWDNAKRRIEMRKERRKEGY